MESISRTDTEIGFVLDKQTGWHLQVTIMEGTVARTRVNLPVSPDLVLTIANALDQYVPQAAENVLRMNLMTFAATATHRQLVEMQRERAKRVAEIAELDRASQAFSSTLIRSNPAPAATQ